MLRNTGECNFADKFNLYYIQSIDDIIKSIREETNKGKKTSYVIKVGIQQRILN